MAIPTITFKQSRCPTHGDSCPTRECTDGDGVTQYERACTETLVAETVAVMDAASILAQMQAERRGKKAK